MELEFDVWKARKIRHCLNCRPGVGKVKRSEKLHICANMDKSEKMIENLSDTNGDIANPCVQLLKKVGHILLSMEYEVGSSWKCFSWKRV